MTTPHIETCCLLVADISGYTKFLNSVADAHPDMYQPGAEVPLAFEVMGSLLDFVTTTLAPAFSLSEVEGDAVFAYAAGEEMAGRGNACLEMVGEVYRGFKEQIVAATTDHHHQCSACIVFTTLELKFVLHRGSAVLQAIGGRERLLGPDVNLVHRLLKNRVVEATGHRAYLLVTDAAVDFLGINPGLGIPHHEEYADTGMVDGVVIGLTGVGVG